MKKLGAIILALGFIALFAGCKTDVDVVELTKIEVTQKPSKTEYFVGEELDLTGLKVTAFYNDGSSADVTKDAKTSGFDSDEATKSQTVTVTYGGKSATFTVKIKAVELTDIAITTQPTKKEYFVGETLDLTGLKVTATYNNGTTADVTTSVTASGFDSSAAVESQTVTVTYEGKTATFTVKISAVEVTKIELTSKPEKKEYFVGDTIDLTGIKVTATYNNGTTADVTASVTPDFDSSTAAESKTVTVTYGGKTATFTVKIKAVELTGITVTTQPAKTEYCIDEALDKTGLIVTATYNNGKTEDVAASVTTDFDSSTAAESKTVTVTYGGKTATFTVTIKNIKKMTVNEFITAIGTAVETITYDTTKPAGVTLSTDGKTANVYGVKLSGAFGNSTGYKFPTTLVTADLKGLDTSGVTNMSYMFYNCKSLTSLDVSSFDTSSVTNMSSMFSSCSKLTSLNVSSFNTSSVTNMYAMFSQCSSLTSLDVSRFNTSKVTNMGYMFYYCSKLTSLDVSRFDTSSVTSMFYLFRYCTSLTSLDVSRFDTSKVKNMGSMFSYCTKFTSLDVSNFDTSSVTDMNYMFSNCTSLTGLDISNFDTSSVTNMSGMFNGCSKLTGLDLSKFDTSSVTNMSYMFSSCTSLTGLDLSKFDTSSVTNVSYMFRNCTSLTSLDLSSFDTSAVTSKDNMLQSCGTAETPLAVTYSSGWTLGTDTTLLEATNLSFTLKQEMTVNEFITALGTAVETITYDTTKPAGVTLSTDGKTANVYGVKLSGAFSNSTGYKFPTKLVTADLRGLDTSGVTSMSHMFHQCTKLTSLDVSSFNTSSVKLMDCMFEQCNLLTSLDVSRFDTSSVTGMYYMFSGCSKLTSLDVSNFDTSKVTSMYYMFSGCKSLTSLDVSRFNTSKVTSMGYMFSYCESLTSLDVSSFDTSSVTYMFCIFQHCSSLTSLDVSRFNTSKVTNMGSMFSYCTKLTSLDLSSFNTSSVTSKDKMFQLCGTSETPLAVTYSTGWTLGTEATLLGATNLSFTLKQ